jgi:hypothetical protein
MVDVHAADHNALADALNNMGWGEIGQRAGKVAAPTGVVGTPVLVPLLSGITFTALATRRYRIEINASVANSASPGATALYIQDGATTLTRALGYAPTFVGYSYHVQGAWEGTLAAGSHTINLSISLAGGAGTVGMDANDFSMFTVDDIGPV